MHSTTASTTPDPSGRSGAAALLALVAVVFALSLLLAHTLPLLDPDEGRNAEVAREMAATGDWVVPHLAGMPYLDKPPGLFWAEALAIRALGATRVAVRLPAALAGALALWLIGALALREAGTRRALLVAALLATAPLFAVLSAYVIFDMPLTLCVTGVWIGIVRELNEGPSPRRRLAMFAAMTAGVLLKGPVLLAWGIGGSLGAAVLVRSRAPLRWLGWWPGWLLVFGVAGGWFAAATRRYPEYPRYAFLEESLERLTSDSFHRQQGAWFVPAVLAAGALPWSLATPWGGGLSRSSRVALGFVAFAALFFTASHSKLVTYLLPALPPLAWIAAEGWSAPARARRGAVGAAIVLAALAAACALAPRFTGAAAVDDALPGRARLLALALLAGAAIAAVGAVRRRAGPALAASLAFTPLVLVLLGPALFAYAGSHSGEPLARAIRNAAPGGTIRFESCYSSGTDFALGHVSTLVSARGLETTSNYQVRYRDRLIRRGEWTPVPLPAAEDGADVVVRRTGHDGGTPPAGWIEIFRDARFVAFRTSDRRP